MADKQNSCGGFSLVEVLVAIAVLAVVIVPIGSALTTAFRLNAASDEAMRDQLAVSGAVETLMAEGFDPDLNDPGISSDEAYRKRFPNVSISGDAEMDGRGYALKVECGRVSVDTFVPAAGGEP